MPATTTCVRLRSPPSASGNGIPVRLRPGRRRARWWSALRGTLSLYRVPRLCGVKRQVCCGWSSSGSLQDPRAPEGGGEEDPLTVCGRVGTRQCYKTLHDVVHGPSVGEKTGTAKHGFALGISSQLNDALA